MIHFIHESRLGPDLAGTGTKFWVNQFLLVFWYYPEPEIQFRPYIPVPVTEYCACMEAPVGTWLGLRVVMGCLTVVMGLLSLCDQAGSPIPAAMCDQPLNSSSSPSCVPASALFDCTPDCLGGTDESPAQCIALSTLDSVQQTALV